MINTLLQYSLPLLCAIISLLYFYRSSMGLERHLKKVSYGFAILALFELLSLSSSFRNSIYVWLFELVAPYGVLNIVSFVLLIIGVMTLASWTWYYLLKRLSTQLFMLSMTGAVLLSLVTTGIFVTLLLKSVETESLIKLSSNAAVTSSLLEEKRLRIASETKQFAMDNEVVNAVSEGNRQVLQVKVRNQMMQTGVSSIVIVDKNGAVLLNSENEDERGASLSSDKFIEKALSGESASGYFVTSATVAPSVSLRYVSPTTGGAIMVSMVMDNAFVDGIKNSTGLSISIYGDKIMSATTEEVGNSKVRLMGIKEINPKVISSVYEKGEIYASSSELGDNKYLSAYVPLKNQNNEVVSVMQVSQREVAAIQAAGQAVQTTFGLIILIMILLAWPLNMICKRLVAEWE